MAQVWMVRAGDSEICDEIQQRGYVGIDFEDETNFSGLKNPEEFLAFSASRGMPTSGHGFWQTSRFLFEMQIGERVITYNKRDRVYLVGELTGSYQYLPKERRRSHARPVRWIGQVSRDSLSVDTKFKLGSTLTIFNPSESASAEIEVALKGRSASEGAAIEVVATSDPEPRRATEERAQELIKDIVAALDWEQMQELIAGILRAMGYKTRVSQGGGDRGRDIIASPDGLGLSDPRIIAEVKHRQGAMGAPEISNFVATLRGSDRGLFVSTGGFTKEARYEADRAQAPVTLLDLDDVA